MLEFKGVKKGDILSGTTFYTVDSISSSELVVTESTTGKSGIKIGNKYAEKLLNSSDFYSTEKEKTATELSNIIQFNPEVAMSIYFKKKDKNKSKSQYNDEIKAKCIEINDCILSKGLNAVEELLKNPVSKVIEGEMRLIKGYSKGTLDPSGRLEFCDVEDKSVVKGVDPRTIEYVIVKGTKYIKK